MATRIPRDSDDENDASDTEWRSPVGAVSSPATIQTDEDDEASDIAAQFTALMGATATEKMRVKLYRIQPRTGQLEWCDDMTPSQITSIDVMGDIRERWGPGQYEFRLLGPKGPLKRIRQHIAPAPEPRSAGAVAVAAPQNDAIAQALSMIAQTQAAILQALAQPKDNGAEFDRMLRLAEVMRGNAAPAAPAVDQLSMMTKVFDVLKGAKSTMRELNDEAPPEPADPIMAALPKVIDLVTSSQRASAPEPLALVPPASLTQNRATATTISNPAPETPPEPQPETVEQMMLRGEIEDLIDMAKANEPPEKGGERIAERMPDEFLPYLQNRYWFELVAQVFPAVREHETWLRAAKAHADKLFAEAEEDPEGLDAP